MEFTAEYRVQTSNAKVNKTLEKVVRNQLSAVRRGYKKRELPLCIAKELFDVRDAETTSQNILQAIELIKKLLLNYRFGHAFCVVSL